MKWFCNAANEIFSSGNIFVFYIFITVFDGICFLIIIYKIYSTHRNTELYIEYGILYQIECITILKCCKMEVSCSFSLWFSKSWIMYSCTQKVIGFHIVHVHILAFICGFYFCIYFRLIDQTMSNNQRNSIRQRNVISHTKIFLRQRCVYKLRI